MAGSTANASPARTLPHIHDITSVRVDQYANKPLRKALEDSLGSMRQAKSLLSFRRPDLALSEFIKASTIAIELVPRHKDFSSLRDRRELKDMYQHLVREIKTNNAIFETVKAEIRIDNEQTGVQPKTLAANKPLSSRDGSFDSANAASRHGDNKSNTGLMPGGSAPALSPKKPAIHPKPASLKGKSIQKPSAESKIAPATSDLVARFQNLRPVMPTVQDPRIKTHPIVVPPATPSSTLKGAVEPRADPSPAEKENWQPPLKAVASTHFHSLSMPRMPAAIYSPARGSVSNQAANLPSSTPRGMFSRTNSMTSVPGSQASTLPTPPAASSSSTDDSFATTHSLVPNVTFEVTVPDGDTITVADLHRYICLGARSFKILIIDVRPRERFDEGHITSQATICVEPLTLFEDMSADMIADRMVLGSNSEVKAFERRDKFDLVVLYDEDSERFPATRSEGNQSLRYLRDALVLYDDGRELQREPKLLAGGLTAWIDAIGPYSVEDSPSPKVSMAAHPLDRPAEDKLTRLSVPRRPALSCKVVSLPETEIRRWEDILKHEEKSPISPFSPIRSTEDFLRRFPDVSNIKESMTSAQAPPAQLDSLFPPVPARPAPAVPRPSYTGLAQDGDDFEVDAAKPATVAVRAARVTPTARSISRCPANLKNPANTCYADSVFQILLASTDFAAFLWSGKWMDIDIPISPEDGWSSPRHPQILTRILAMLFLHVRSPAALEKKTEPTILRKYIGDLAKKAPGVANFGSITTQQDTGEYLDFILHHLDDETNSRRHLIKKDQGDAPEPIKDENLEQFTHRFYKRRFESHNSLVDAYLRSVKIEKVVCKNSKTTGKCFDKDLGQWRPQLCTAVCVAMDESSHPIDLIAGIRGYEFEALPRRCSACQEPLQQETKFISLSKYLYVRMNRAQSLNMKVKTPVSFPVREALDMTPLVWSDDFDRSELPPQFEGPFKYELYGLICHRGHTALSGHNTAFVRKEGKDWREWWFLDDLDSDTRAKSFSLQTVNPNATQSEICQRFVAKAGEVVQLCYRRQMRPAPQKETQHVKE